MSKASATSPRRLAVGARRRGRQSLFVGVRGDQVGRYLNKSDLILAAGSSLSPGRCSHAIPDAATKTIIHCTVDELHIGKMSPTAHAVIGDARLTLKALRQRVSDRRPAPDGGG